MFSFENYSHVVFQWGTSSRNSGGHFMTMFLKTWVMYAVMQWRTCKRSERDQEHYQVKILLSIDNYQVEISSIDHHQVEISSSIEHHYTFVHNTIIIKYLIYLNVKQAAQSFVICRRCWRGIDHTFRKSRKVTHVSRRKQTFSSSGRVC